MITPDRTMKDTTRLFCPYNHKQVNPKDCKGCGYSKEGLCDYPYVGNQPRPVQPDKFVVEACPAGKTKKNCYTCAYDADGTCAYHYLTANQRNN